ncbi:MAG: hypothetical protein V7K48_18660 [Nostoc sp.]|uniref:hypothetical protein n=1 Tax=Nostoc sp. TaxID=1180 RepID=UPI002FFD012D
MLQGVEDAYLAACEIREGKVKIDFNKLTVENILASNRVDYETGFAVTKEQNCKIVKRRCIHTGLMLPNLKKRRCIDLFKYLLETGGAEQKTIIFWVVVNM